MAAKIYCILLKSTFHDFPHSLGRIESSCVCAFYLFRFPRSNGWEMFSVFLLFLYRSGVCDVRMDKIHTNSHPQMRNGTCFPIFSFPLLLLLSIDDDVLVILVQKKTFFNSFIHHPSSLAFCVCSYARYVYWIGISLLYKRL